MSKTIQKRMSGRMGGELVVFLIGMRVNRWWKVHRWLRVARAMPRMIPELEKNPELGFFGAEQWFGRTTIMVSSSSGKACSSWSGDYESVYVNMMPFGLGRAVALVEATGKRANAPSRLVAA